MSAAQHDEIAIAHNLFALLLKHAHLIHCCCQGDTLSSHTDCHLEQTHSQSQQTPRLKKLIASQQNWLRSTRIVPNIWSGGRTRISLLGDRLAWSQGENCSSYCQEAHEFRPWSMSQPSEQNAGISTSYPSTQYLGNETGQSSGLLVIW